MTPKRLHDLLRDAPTPPSTQARERAVSEARAAMAERPVRALPRPRLLSLAAAALIVVVVLLTPPGRAASAWVGELVGIGEVGGKPTLQERGFDSENEIVIDNGTAPDGTRYEWVAYDCKVDLESEGVATKFTGIGVSLEWPGVRGHEGGGFCESLVDRPTPGAFASHGVHIVPSQFRGVEEPDLVVSGSTGPRVHRVEVVYVDGAGERHELPVDFVRVEGELERLADRPEPLGTFVAFVPGDWAARDEVQARLDLRAQMGTGDLKLGPLARRDREQAREARAACESKQPDPADFPTDPDDRAAIERAFRPLTECLDGRMPASPIEYVAYDEDGRVLQRAEEPLIIPAPRATEAAGREKPGAERFELPASDDVVGPRVVLLRGRAPEGALYEVFTEEHDTSGNVDSYCLTTWWPYVRFAGAGGACGPGVLPETAFGRRNPDEVMAKPYGFLGNAEPATLHLTLSGYARAHVARLRVVYRDKGGDWHDAPVKLRRVRAPLAERLGADEPFGYWMAFVPRSAGKRAPVDVYAYGEDGAELGRYRHEE